MTIKLSTRLRVLPNIAPQDITTARTGAYADASGAQALLVAVNAGPVAPTKTVTLQMMQAVDANGTSAKALGAPVTVTAPTGGSAIAFTADAQITDLDDNNGFAFVAALLSSNNASAVLAAATLILGNNRFNP
ncbi:hypothetical protein [Lichenihabitans psoromatis]|uniref:hypothetical protein n=1 Tax=Lichenihabitans psoromatis TaxID=2528642 RepID=UPI0010384322|nr:hypothetical protein [Lichenihabitans psoromatis]